MFSNIIRKTAKQTTKSFVRQASNATTKQASQHSKRLIYSLGGLGVGAAATYASMDQTSTPRMANKSIYGMLESFGDRLDRIEEALGVGLSVFSDEIQKIREVKVSNPGNRAMKYFDEAYCKAWITIAASFHRHCSHRIRKCRLWPRVLRHEAGRLRDLL